MSAVTWCRLPARCALAIVAVALLAACGERPLPPPAFGDLDGLVGGPDVEGLYRWPPAAGEFADGFDSRERPWPRGYPAYVDRGPMQFEVQATPGAIVLRTRADGARGPGGGWGFVEHGRREARCSRGVMAFAPRPVHAPGSGGGIATEAFALARLEDGGLAIGTMLRQRVPDMALVGWGDQSAGDIRQPDRVLWRWSKLEPVDAGAESTR